MFDRRSAAVAIAAALIAGFAGLGVPGATADGDGGAQPGATADGDGGAQPLAERTKLKEMMSVRTVDSVGQAKRLAAAAGLTGHTITFITHIIPGRDVFIDLPPADVSPGDIFLAEAKVFNGTHSRRIGTAVLHCEIHITTFTCSHSFRLNGRGKLLLTKPGLGMGAITGGTGDFKSVGGQGMWFDLGPPDFDMFFVVELVR